MLCDGKNQIYMRIGIIKTFLVSKKLFKIDS